MRRALASTLSGRVSPLLRIFATASVTALLVAGVTQAAKPVPSPTDGLGYQDSTGNNFTIPLPLTGQAPAVVIDELVLPNGNYLINGSVLLLNTSATTNSSVVCYLWGGESPNVVLLDGSEARLPMSDGETAGSAKLAFTGAIARQSSGSTVRVWIDCTSLHGGLAEYGRLNAVLVSSLTETLNQ